MSREKMSLFLPAKINRLEDYERYSNTKAYLLQKSGSLTFFKDQKSEIHELAEKSGYADFNKFTEHRREWHNINRRIPLGYLSAIGVDFEVLDFVVNVDYQEFRRALKVPRYPQYFTIRLMPSIYQSVEIPEEIPENKAIEALQKLAAEKDRLCFINYQELLSILIKPDGQVTRNYFVPAAEISGDYWIPSLQARPDFAKDG